MTCKKCGSQMGDDQRFCSFCGEDNQVQQGWSGQDAYNNESMNGYNAAQNQYSFSNSLPMGWYNFLVKFALIAGAVINCIYGILYLTGKVYDMKQDGSSDLVYLFFKDLKTLDVIYGLALFALAAFGIFVRSELAKYKADGPKYLYALNGSAAALIFLYALIAGSIIEQSAFSAEVVGSIIGSVSMIVVNKVYFDKRAHLFVN